VKQRRRRQLISAGLIGAGAGITVALSQALVTQAVDALLPNVRRLNSYNRPGTITVLAADGQVIQKLGPATREKLISGQMPLLVERAFIAAEDRRFYEHDGIDPIGIGRAMVRNISQGSGRGRGQHDHPAAGPHGVPEPGPHGDPQAQGGPAGRKARAAAEQAADP